MSEDSPTQRRSAHSTRPSRWSGLAGLAAIFVAMMAFKDVFTTLPVPILDTTYRGELDARFVDVEGQPRSLSEFRGRLVLVNVWATGCPPCRDEMPALERLRARVRDPLFAIVAISVDVGGVDVASRYLARESIDKLEPFAGEEQDVMGSLHVVALPTSILLDKEGGELGRVVGPADWGSAEAEALIRNALGVVD